MKKVFLTCTLEKTLLETGSEKTLDFISGLLQKKFRSDIMNCYSHPEYLKYALNRLEKKLSSKIINILLINLEDFSDQRSIKDFMKVIS